ncbi:unnamed protein product [Polarella glacialis]|uniref:MORN repeat-containing protein 3 n=1 Tax=Polarella glacialis TaxID=89957 RepID=A0A813KRR3_POLGL|nr:unnamed protein product [Polarella glacialis]|eukprot:CAMPEP_0115161726 /NCGR_PEP_ID=MMETSP0227-20121206/71557_1 /TAXON_ID=89957 /ORGANISM="Polarella glacialis, Strain CCMP 1383" /LENGTH=403 /DNA_ID=CAMNT_0002573839 /DNA_START=89 /DNA_END=1300 /DNA_ORIENTATION=+
MHMSANIKVSHPSPDLGDEVEEKKLATMRPKKDAWWQVNDTKAMKSGQRGTIYWVGKAIMGEDGAKTGHHVKGCSYQGEWDNNQKNGYGVQVFPNGQKYEGQWAAGLRSGEGTLWVPVGKAQKLRKLYVGGWKDDRRHGRGTCFFKDGQFFQGSWIHGKMHGQGTLRYSSGDLYIGDWYDGLRSGKGTLNKANGDCYEGYWLNDRREGSGSFFYAESGKVFVGDWANDLPKAGVYTQANPNPEQATLVPKTSELPPVMLALPAEVLEGALSAVRNARKSFRATTTPVERLFDEDEVEALKAAFQGVQQADGTIRLAELQGLCAHLGTEVSMPRLMQLMATVGLESEDHRGPSADFDNFLRVVALLLDEEAAANPGGSQTEGHFDASDYNWDEDGQDGLGEHMM